MDNTINYYNKNADRFVQGTFSIDFSDTQDRFLTKRTKGFYILDFGYGRDTKHFIDKGYNVDAIDGSEELCKIAS